MVVAGAGPAGLMLACELRLVGVSVLVLEREAEPGAAHKAGAMGARSLNAPRADAFHRRAGARRTGRGFRRPSHRAPGRAGHARTAGRARGVDRRAARGPVRALAPLSGPGPLSGGPGVGDDGA